MAKIGCEVVGVSKGINSLGELVIIDDDGDDITMDPSFFQYVPYDTRFNDERISFFYYRVDRDGEEPRVHYDIFKMSDTDKQIHLCHNVFIGNYYMSSERLAWTLEN